jgi:DNA-binding XRE family transcriptional regulator
VDRIDLEKIIRLRERIGKTQDQAAKAVGLSRVTYLNRESNGKFKQHEIKKLAAFLEVKESELYVVDSADISLQQEIKELRQSLDSIEKNQQLIFDLTRSYLSAALEALLPGKSVGKILEDAETNALSSNRRLVLKGIHGVGNPSNES